MGRKKKSNFIWKLGLVFLFFVLIPHKEIAEINKVSAKDQPVFKQFPAKELVKKEKAAKNETKHNKKKEKSIFKINKINKSVFKRIKGKSYKLDCEIPLKELRYLQISHYGFDGKVHTGEMIVNRKIAKDMIAVFKELYKKKYPIEKMVLIDAYDADDEASMKDNNTTCFNYRKISGSKNLSKHSQGLAIDINPLYNPYVKTKNKETIISPAEGEEYADRSKDCIYYIEKNDICYKTFKKNGFTWGGEWRSLKDYQHFEKNE